MVLFEILYVDDGMHLDVAWKIKLIRGGADLPQSTEGSDVFRAEASCFFWSAGMGVCMLVERRTKSSTSNSLDFRVLLYCSAWFDCAFCILSLALLMRACCLSMDVSAAATSTLVSIV